jgi:hypothetical protein
MSGPCERRKPGKGNLLSPKPKNSKSWGRMQKFFGLERSPLYCLALKKVGPMWGRYTRPTKMEKHEGRLG